MCVGNARSVTHQAAGFGILTQGINRRHPMVGRQRNELDATVVGQRARADQEPINWFSRKGRKSRIDVAASAGEEDFDLLINGRSRSSDFRNEGLSEGPVRIDDHGKAVGSRLQIVQEPKLLCPKFIRQKADAGDVAARPVEAGDEAALDRVVSRSRRRLVSSCSPPWPQLPRERQSQRSMPPDGVPDRLPDRGADRIGPVPNDTRWPHYGPRRSRFRGHLVGMRSQGVPG